jgi:hypothetical protein
MWSLEVITANTVADSAFFASRPCK